MPATQRVQASGISALRAGGAQGASRAWQAWQQQQQWEVLPQRGWDPRPMGHTDGALGSGVQLRPSWSPALGREG